MKLSIVTGTHNRLESLQRMIASVRGQLHWHYPYEFIIVDAGSTDGTLEYLRAQKDVRLIEHGARKGAIRAFCDGAEAARGEYVVLANDDVEFKPYSLLAAARHLDTTPTCGAVAFADNRTWSVTPQEIQGAPFYRTEGIGAFNPDGSPTMVTYAQVGMVRREIGAAAAWWGARDPIMGNAWTYGGDSYLSARIWQMGLTVDPVEGAVVHDYIVRDDLRNGMAEKTMHDSSLFHQRIPRLDLPAERHAVALTPRLRILTLTIYEFSPAASKEYGMADALRAYGDVIEIDYLHEAFNLALLCKHWQPDLLLTQIQGYGERLTAAMLADARAAAPGMVVVNWNGDAHERGLIGDDVLTILEHVDIQTTVNAAVLPVYERLGIRAAYWQIGYKDPATAPPNVPHYDVLFQGNCYDNRRTELVRTLKSLRMDVGVFGNCKPSDGNTHYDFAKQAALYHTATITVGDTFPHTRAFVSNRVFQALANGAFLLQQYSEDLEAYTGLKAGVHYVEWTDNADLVVKINDWIRKQRAIERQQIAAAGQAFVRANFSYDAQARKLFTDILPLMERETTGELEHA